MPTFAKQVIDFHKNISLTAALPAKIKVLNPYEDNALIQDILKQFYSKFFDDHQPRKLMVGINPGRLGGGVTGIPFTDTKRLSEVCGIDIGTFETHEPSSVFVYELIQAFGGPEEFYREFYIRSEEHTSELQSRPHLVCRLLLEKKKKYIGQKLNYITFY